MQHALRPIPVRLTSLFVMLVCLLAPGHRVAHAETTEPSDAAALHELTADDVQAWLDGMVPSLLQEDRLPGAAVSIVKDGQIIASRGYGAADRWSITAEGATPVDADRTMFRTASITKLSTAVAAMQLVERGQLDLDAGISRYLDVDLDFPLGEPTARNLMTHTAGFEEHMGEGFLGSDPDAVPELRERVRDVPVQIHAPGTVSAYSNYGVALLGYIVQQVSGVPYDQYVADNIYAPLGMTNSTVAQPVPERFAGQIASGFGNPAESTTPKPFEYLGDAPAGSQSVSATDMARFANFLLGHGPEQVLSHQTLEQMRQPAIDPGQSPNYQGVLNTLGLQLFIEQVDGVTVVGHGGDLAYSHSLLRVFPEQDMGIFVVQNGTGKGGTGDIRGPVLEQFIHRYVTPPDNPQAPDTALPRSAGDIVGSYITSRRQESGILKLSIPLQQVTIVANDDGTVSFAGDPGRYRQVADGTWAMVEGHPATGSDIFQVRGDTIMMTPAHELQRTTSPIENRNLLIAVVAIALFTGIGTLISPLLCWRVHRRLRKAGVHEDTSSATEKWSRCFMPLMGAGMIIFLIALASFATTALETFDAPMGVFRVAQVGLLMVGAGGVAGAIHAVQGARRRRWGALIWGMLVAMTVCGLLTIAAYYNLLAVVPHT